MPSFWGRVDTSLKIHHFYSRMKKSLFIFFSCGLLLTLFAVSLFYFRENSSFVSSYIQKKMNPESALNSAAPSSNQSPTAPSLTSEENESKKLKKSKMMAWLEERGTNMSSFSKSDSAELDQKISNLEPEDLADLKSIALDTKKAANIRLLSLYMLGKASQELTAINDFLQSKIPIHPQAPAHSVEELENNREKALRVMAFEQKVEAAKTSAKAKKELAELILTIQDAWLRSYAERRFAEL